MGSNLNFNNYGNEGIPSSLVRQQSIYSLTFDELQNTMGGSLGKDFGSMNMDELLKNIWTAEESQNMGVSGAVGASGGGGGVQLGIGACGGLQRQGSLTLPRTLSQKTVEDVWKDIVGGGKDGGGSAAPQRQQTLGEMTLEEFLARAGVVREDNINGNVNQPMGKSGINGGGFYGDLAQLQSNSDAVSTGIGFGFQQAAGQGIGLMGNSTSESSHQGSTQSVNMPLSVNGTRYPQQPLSSSQSQQPQQQEHKNPQQLVPRQPNMVYGAPMPLASGVQLSPRIRGGIVGMSDPVLNGNLVQGGGMGMVGLGAGAVAVATGSPASQLSSDGVGKSNGDTSSVSPVPYMFNGGVRGRRTNGAVEKVVERRQRRMIKNRESAARSRARKQAYTMELEEEVAKLKAENEELRKKQAEILEMQNNEMRETTDPQQGAKKRCLRRTQTGPW